MKNWLILSCLVSALVLAAVAWADPQEERGPKPEQVRGDEQRQGPEMMLRAVMQNPELAARVGLTEAQQKAIREAAFAQREQMVTLRSQAELARMQVEKLLAADPVDQEAVMKAVDAAGLQDVALKKAEIAFRLKMKDLVGKDVVNKIRDEMKSHFAERRRAAMAQGGPDRQAGPGVADIRRQRIQQAQGAPQPPPPDNR